MAGKLRIHQLAKQLGMTNVEMLEHLRKEGVPAASHLAVLDDDTVELIREQFSVNEPDEEIIEEDDIDDVDIDIDIDVNQPKRQRTPRKSKSDRKSATTKPAAGTAASASPAGSELHLKPPITVKELADALGLKTFTVISELMQMKVIASINQVVDPAVAEQICQNHDVKLVIDRREKATVAIEEDIVAPEDIVYDDAETEPRPPVVAFLGHVDHGKTSLQDAIRKTNVTAGEAGGITQHIGASNIEWDKHAITLIDTPGHEAFTAMRARGANTTDIAILVVAADDGIMPQTIEAINHAKAAEVPIIVAVNKIDLASANPDQVLVQLQQHGLMSEDWGGDVGVIRCSAISGEGIDALLERIILEAELLELKANPKLPAKAVVIESQLEQGLGATVNVLVKNGTIHVGDFVICGQQHGRVKALIDARGKRLKKAGPSVPVKVVGLTGVVECGALLVGCPDEKQAKRLAETRAVKQRQEQLQPARNASLEDLFRQIEEEARKELKLVVKTDVQGTGEAVADALSKLESTKISLQIIHFGVGAISESDVLLAAASDAIVVGFHVRVNPGVNKLAAREGVEINLYSVIYELTEQIREAMIGMLEPELREEPLGTATILQVFDMSKTKTKICGCSVTKGLIKVGSKARVHRGDELIYHGSVSSLRRFKDDVREVRQGFECGIRLDNFNDFEVDDVIDVYEYKELPPSL